MMGRPDRSVPETDAALAILDREDNPAARTEGQFAAAKAMFGEGRKARATALARAVRADIASTGPPGGAEALSEIDAWLADPR